MPRETPDAWRIYYDDGSTFSSSQGSPEDAPAFGVIAISVPGKQGRPSMWYGDSRDYYFQYNGEWMGADIHGLLDLLLHNKNITAVKQGRLMSTLGYQAIVERARTEPL